MFVSAIDYGTPAYAQAVGLRNATLHKPLNLEVSTKEFSNEYKDAHFALYDASFNMIGCAMLSKDKEDEKKAHLRQVIVQEDFRMCGFGRKLVTDIEQYAIRNGFKELHLKALKEAVPFYTKLGYKKSGKISTLDGIKHYPLRKKLRK